jgi:pimeloyl-ACP methyl ester carboxylesterase
LGSVALWKNFPELVAEATGCSALVYSRYGYGKSDRLTEPRTVDYMHREALESLPELLGALSIRDPILIGHSDGASISIIHAGCGRRQVRGLVLMAPHVFVEDITVAAIAQAKTAFETSDLAAKLGRAVYLLLRRRQAFDLQRFLGQ